MFTLISFNLTRVSSVFFTLALVLCPIAAEALYNNTYLPYRELTLGQAPVSPLFSGLNDGSTSPDGAWYLDGDFQFSGNDNVNGGGSSNDFVKDVMLVPAKGYNHNPGNDLINFNGFSSNVTNLAYLLRTYKSLCSLPTNGNSVTPIGSRIVCKLSLTSASGNIKTSYLPIIIKDSQALYAFNVSQAIQNQPSPGNPFILNSKSSGQLPLAGFFNIPKGSQPTYSLNSTNVCDPMDPSLQSTTVGRGPGLTSRRYGGVDQNFGAPAPACGSATGVVALPTAPGGKVTYPQDWAVTGNILTVGASAAPGIYQVNIQASLQGSDVLGNQSLQIAFQTFYVNVGGANQNYFFSSQTPFSFLYAYNGGYKTKPLPKWTTGAMCPNTDTSYQYTQTVANQFKDVQQINTIFNNGSGYNLSVLATAVGQLQYQNTPPQGVTTGEDCIGITTNNPTATRCNFWATSQLNTPFDGYGASYNPLLGNLGIAAAIEKPPGLGNVDMSQDDQTGVCAYNNPGPTVAPSNTKLVLDFEQPKGADIMSGKAMSGELGTQNDTESFILAAAYVKQLFHRTNYVGVSLDFEAGFSSDPYYTFVKNLADRLAFRGQLLADYDFPQRAFTPGVVVALGPTGVAIFSAYDIAANRAPIAQTDNVNLFWNGKPVWYNLSDIQNGGVPLSQQGLTNSQESFYAMMFAPNPNLTAPLRSINCTDGLDVTNFTYLSGGTIDKKACLDSLYESWSENIHWWAGQQNPTGLNGNNAKMTPDQIFTYYQGRYIPVVPVAQSVTQSPYFVIPKPTITYSQNATAVPAVVSSAVFGQPSPLPNDSKGISIALGNSLGNVPGVVSTSSSVPFQAFYNCPGSSPVYSNCIIVSAPVAFHKLSSEVTGYRFPAIEDYITNDTYVYQYYNNANIKFATAPGSFPTPTHPTNPGIIGVGFFGLGDALSEGISKGCNVPTATSSVPNTSCMEPWYIGFQTAPITSGSNSTPSVDDFYKYYQSNSIDPAKPQNGLNANLFAPLIDNFNVWRTANNLLSTFKSGPTPFSTVNWISRGLPASSFSGNPLTATFTADATVQSGNVKYTCWVLSHTQPARTCNVSQSASGNQASIVLSAPSGVADNDYAVFVRASAGQSAIFADSVYLNITSQ
jgi:hypothetical protein